MDMPALLSTTPVFWESEHSLFTGMILAISSSLLTISATLWHPSLTHEDTYRKCILVDPSENDGRAESLATMSSLSILMTLTPLVGMLTRSVSHVSMSTCSKDFPSGSSIDFISVDPGYIHLMPISSLTCLMCIWPIRTAFTPILERIGASSWI